MNHEKTIHAQRLRRQRRVRSGVTGTAARPRLAVFRSQKHIYAQLIDDHVGRTLAAASSKDAAFRGAGQKGSTQAGASAVGAQLAASALAAGVRAVAFDRRHYKYHGRIRALADAARKAGLDF